MTETTWGPACNICGLRLIEAPKDFVVYWKYIICGECFREGMNRETPEELAKWAETRPFVHLPEEIIEAAKRLASLGSLAPNESKRCKQRLTEWLSTALQHTSTLPRFYSSLLTAPALPSLGAFLSDRTADSWQCLRCNNKVTGLTKRCEACGYRELALYGWDTAAKIYWQCGNCKFALNLVSHSTCFQCHMENPDLTQSPHPSTLERCSQFLSQLF